MKARDYKCTNCKNECSLTIISNEYNFGEFPHKEMFPLDQNIPCVCGGLAKWKEIKGCK
ncbi:MAG: hypothetical protein ACFFG0_52115 [Candidatus Thorarchaeota archaeon]